MADIKQAVREQSCSNCRDTFFCGADGEEERCWCEALAHVPLTAIERRDCFCPRCLSDAIQAALQPGCPVGEASLHSVWRTAAEPVQAATKTDWGPPSLLLEGEDYYSEGGMIVF